MNASETSVTIVRTINGSARKVFTAWTDPTLIRRWFAPAPYEVTAAEVDARVGGRYRVAVVGPNGDMHVTIGEYRELEPGKRLVKTWVYERPLATADGEESLLTVEFREVGPGVTELTLRHERAVSPEDREGMREGWTLCLDKLATLFNGRGPEDSMTMPITRPDLSQRPCRLTLERAMDAPPDALFRAWTEQFDR